MSEDIMEEELYPGGFWSLMRNRETRQRPFRHVIEGLPEGDVDLGALRARTVPPPTREVDDQDKQDFREKRESLKADFAGQSELALLHAQCIAALRRRDPPQVAHILFQRIWAECGADLIEDMDVRWQISAATTFADHGVTMAQRSLGMGLSVMFDMIKMHDSERRLSGQPGRRPFRRKRDREMDAIPFGMEAISLRTGDIDENMLARLWALSEEDAVIAPLARSMLQMAITDRRSIFARMRRMRKRKNRQVTK